MSLKQEPSLYLGTLRPLSQVPRGLETGIQVLPTGQHRSNSNLRSSGKGSSSERVGPEMASLP